MINDRHCLTLHTYNQAEPQENHPADNPITFTVPRKWAEITIQHWFHMGLEEFLDWYTYDHSETIYRNALKQGVVIHSE